MNEKHTYPQPRNIMEQIAIGLQTVNDNIVDMFNLVKELHDAFYSVPEPNTSGAEKPSTEKQSQ